MDQGTITTLRQAKKICKREILTDNHSPSAQVGSLERGIFANYHPLSHVFDEFFQSSAALRPELAAIVEDFQLLTKEDLLQRHQLALQLFRNNGVTFTIYSHEEGVEKIFPFDLIPRIITPPEWAFLEKGLKQRIAALNAFLEDIYHQQRIVKEKVLPADIVFTSTGYLHEMRHAQPKGGIYVHIAGIDLIRDHTGQFIVLEDNLRTPSGVSYVLTNRSILKQIMQPIFSSAKVKAVDNYPLQLRTALLALAQSRQDEPFAVLLTPGSANSAYYEHSFLAQQMGFELVEGQDLFVEEDKVYAKTTLGAKQVDVIYRRVDDEFLDPQVFRADSLLGVPGLMRAYAKGNVLLANAPGNGVADDKAIFSYVPEMIKFYLKEQPILAQVQTYNCADSRQREYVLQHLTEMVIKVVDGAGGYGMKFGAQVSRLELAEIKSAILANPRHFIAQHVIDFSTCPTLIGDSTQQLCMQPRRVDLRPYCVTGKSTWVLPGGLTRVALTEGSYVVNSSQGGGSKDTWVLEGQHE